MSTNDILLNPTPFDQQVESEKHVTVIKPRSGWQFINLRELYEYRDLFRFLVYKTIRVRYAQSALGVGWAIIQPLFSVAVFTIVFGKLASVPSDGVPYALFSFAALLPWTYLSNTVNAGTASLVAESHMISKIYFPRILLPLTAAVARLLDFAIASIILVGLMLYYGVVPNLNVLALPLLLAILVLSAVGISVWLTALAIQYRDVKYAAGFMVQLFMYAAPVVYPASLIPERYQYVYAINPIVGVIEGFRAALLGTRPMPWDLIAIGSVTATVVAVTGAFYFRRRERIFADVA